MKRQKFPLAAAIFIGGAVSLAALFFAARQSGAELSASEMERAAGLGAAIGGAIGLM